MKSIDDEIAAALADLPTSAELRRERIATAALQGLLADSNSRGNIESFAIDAVRFADALIAELDKPQTDGGSK